MKRFILVMLVLFFSGALQLSLAASDDAAVTVNVIAALTVTADNGLDFGTREVGSGVASIASTDGSAGRFSVSGSPSASVTCTFPSTVTLTSGANNLTFTASTPIYYTSNNQGSASTFAAVTGGTTTLDGTTGELYIWFGGQVDIDGTVATGSYSGNYTATVVY